MLKFFYKIILGIALNGLILYLLIRFMPEIKYTGGLEFFIIGGIIVGLMNFLVKPLLKIISLPIIIISGGLSLIALNAFVLWFLSYFLEIAKFHDVTLTFPNIGSYVIGAVVFGILNWITSTFLKF